MLIEACALMLCEDEFEEDEYPPAMLSIERIEEEYLTPSHAPYIDEKTAEFERKLNDKDDKISELESEVEKLEDRINSAGNNDIPTDPSSDELGRFEATFYTAFCPTGCTGTTATGLDVSETIYSPDGYRIIAVDPSVIPLGSIVRVTLDDGSTFEAKAEDTGGDIAGNRIDILVESRDEAYRLGRQAVDVSLIE